jgi:hypothetical protein
VPKLEIGCWYNRQMPNPYLIKLVGVLLTGAGVIALTTSAYLYGTPLTREEKQKAKRDGHPSGTLYRLPFNLETIASALFFIGGIGILTWSKFELCPFLAHWLPDLPEALLFLLTCR